MNKESADPFLAHEALDRAHLIARIFSEFVADHPFVQVHSGLRREGEKLAEALGAFYQSVGQVSFSDDEALSPNQLAMELGISPKTLRGFLRKKFPRDRILKAARWRLGQNHVAAARENWKRDTSKLA